PRRPQADELPRRRPAIELATRLHGTSVERPAETGAVATHLAELAPHLSPSERRLLAHAVETGTAICIDYINGEGNPSTRVIEKIRLDAPFLIAWCRLRVAERIFHTSRIQAVAPPSLMP
ncbi:WYL domain-containing protein, partial [Actinomadura rubrisoli]|uniref:WYL domain-containing protein n=1 Tax=Actinomadura rubrisoli TaxID=2530368 RepID=UPI001A9F764C